MLLVIKKKRRKPAAKKQPMLSWKEICEQYPSKWVLIVDWKTNKWQEVLRGRVVAHGDDPNRVSDAIANLGLRNTGLLFTGPVRNEKTAFLL